MENENQGDQPTELKVETVHYEDGASATGVAPMPDHSPDGAPAVTNDPNAKPYVDYETLYHTEKLDHEFTKLQLATARKMIDNAEKMGFKFGVGIHAGS